MKDTPAPSEPAQNDVKKSRKRREADSRIKEIVDYFSQAFELRTGSPPTVAGGHWGANIRVLLRNHSAETIKAVVDRFFSWNGRSRFSWSAFYATFDNLLPHVLQQAARRDKV